MTEEVALPGGPAPEEHPDTDRALKLRAWGFLATALGGLMAGIGALLPWAKISQFAVGYNTFPGIDFWQGIAVLVLGFLIVIVIFTMRFQGTYERRRLFGRIVIVAAVAILVMVGLFVVRADTQVLDINTRAQTLVEESGQTENIEELERKAVAELRKQESLTFQIGLFVSAAGALFALLGAIISLRWARLRGAIQQEEGSAFGAPKGSVPETT